MRRLRALVRSSLYARHILISIGLLLGVITTGVVGYNVIEHTGFKQALYMTIITISTVGFKEVTDLSTAGMYFTIFSLSPASAPCSSSWPAFSSSC